MSNKNIFVDEQFFSFLEYQTLNVINLVYKINKIKF